MSPASALLLITVDHTTACPFRPRPAVLRGVRLKTDAPLLHTHRHIALRRSGAAPALLTAIVGGVFWLASLAWHHDLAQAAPVATLGTLHWQVSKMAFDAAKVITIFFGKNLVVALWHPARYGQLRAPLVEQRVPDVDATESN